MKRKVKITGSQMKEIIKKGLEELRKKEVVILAGEMASDNTPKITADKNINDSSDRICSFTNTIHYLKDYNFDDIEIEEAI